MSATPGGEVVPPIDDSLRDFLARSPCAVVVLDVRTVSFLYANPSFERLLGYGPGELERRTPWTVSPRHQPCGSASAALAAQHIAAAAEGNRSEFEWTHETRSGKPIDCFVRLHRFQSGDRVLVAGRVEPRNEERTLGGVVGDELRGLLTAICVSGDHLDEAGIADESLETIREASHRAVALVQLLLARRAPVSGWTRVDATLEGARPVLERIAGGPLALDLACPRAAVPISPAALVRVAMQLALCVRDPRTVRLLTDVASNGDVVLELSAPRHDIDRETADRMLDHDGVLGFPVRAARHVGGDVAVCSSPGVGSRIRVRLPRA